MPKRCRIVPETHVRRRKRRKQRDIEADDMDTSEDSPDRSEESKARDCTICLHYNSMLYLDFLEANQMVVVEQPWLRVISTFPEALQRRVYGAN